MNAFMTDPFPVPGTVRRVLIRIRADGGTGLETGPARLAVRRRCRGRPYWVGVHRRGPEHTTCLGTAHAGDRRRESQVDPTRRTALVAGLFYLITFVIGVVSLLAVVPLRQDLAGAPRTDTAALV